MKYCSYIIMPRPIKSLELQGLSFNRNSKFYEFFKSYTSKASVACERHNCSTTARNCSDSDVCMVGVHEPPPPPPRTTLLLLIPPPHHYHHLKICKIPRLCGASSSFVTIAISQSLLTGSSGKLNRTLEGFIFSSVKRRSNVVNDKL